MDPTLVDKIVQQVVEALKAQGVGAPASGAPAALARTESAPAEDAPLRVKPVLKEFTAGGNPVLVVPGRSNGAKKAAAPRGPSKVFVTADMLAQRAVAGNGQGGVIELAHHEFLTPNAEDLAERKHWMVRKSELSIAKAADQGSVPMTTQVPAAATAQSQAKAASTQSGAGTAWKGCATPSTDSVTNAGSIGLFVHKPTDKVKSALSGMHHDGVRLLDFGASDCWMRNLDSLAKAIAAGQVSAGVAILPYAADAMLLAGKVKGVRAVQGTRVESVASAVRHFDANLLVLEHALSTFHEMRQMVRLFVAPRGEAMYKELMETLAKLEGC